MKLFTTTTTIAAGVLLLATEVPRVLAKPEFVARIPNGGNVPGVLAVGHVDPEGSSKDVNAFGNAFHKAGNKWTTALCQADSDGDGQTNGQELGDPCCAFVVGSNAKVLWTTGVSHPGDKSKTSDATLWASVSCTTASDGSITKAAPSANATSGGVTASDTIITVPTPSPTSSASHVNVFALSSLLAIGTGMIAGGTI